MGRQKKQITESKICPEGEVMTEDMASIDGGQGRPPQGGKTELDLRTEEGRSWGEKCPRER